MGRHLRFFLEGYSRPSEALRGHTWSPHTSEALLEGSERLFQFFAQLLTSKLFEARLMI